MAVDIEETFATLLADSAAVVAIAVDRFFPNRLPIREELPAVIWRRVSGSPMPRLNGVSKVKRAVFQFESWSATSQEEARDLDLKVQAKLDGLKGPIGSWWIQVMKLTGDADQDNPQIPVHADDLGLFCSFCEFFVVYEFYA